MLLLAGCGGGGGAGTGAGGLEGASGDSVVVQLEEQNASGESGTATLEPADDGTTILLESTGGRSAQPAHIRRGGCDATGEEDVAYELPDLFDGISGDTANIPLDELRSGGYAIDIHGEDGAVVACGVIE